MEGWERMWAPKRPVVLMTLPSLAVLLNREKRFPLGLGIANLATRVVIVGLMDSIDGS
jgi:hypothetical protein